MMILLASRTLLYTYIPVSELRLVKVSDIIVTVNSSWRTPPITNDYWNFGPEAKRIGGEMGRFEETTADEAFHISSWSLEDKERTLKTLAAYDRRWRL